VGKMRACLCWCSNLLAIFALISVAAGRSPQTSVQTSQPASAAPQRVRGQGEPTKAEILRGAYGPYRANNDLLFYHLDIRIDPAKKLISGENTIRFRMLQDDTRIQLDLADALSIDKILLDSTPLHYERDSGAVFVDFPYTLRGGSVYSIDFYYSGTPVQTGRFGGFTFGTDPSGHPWIYTACEGIGASIWWPNKDQWRDEVETMQISVAIPNDLVDVSNGRFQGKTDLGDGYTRWDWLVHYPINNYDVSVNIGNYLHFSEKMGDLDMDFYALPEDLEKARKQFSQAKGMIEAYELTSASIPSRRMATSWSRSHTLAWNTRALSRMETISPTAIWSATGPASASVPVSTSSSFTRADTSGSATASAQRTPQICGFTKAGRRTSRVSTSNICTAKTMPLSI